MPHESAREKPSWYVLNFIGESFRDTPQKVVDRYNAKVEMPLELFAPTYVVREERQGEMKFRTVNLTFHYVFVRGEFYNIKRLCGQPNGFSFLIDRVSESRYATIDDTRMTHFMNIARAYKNCLPYFSLEDIDLEDGDLVEVVKGDFPGLIGSFIPNAKSKTGNIVLKVFNNVGTIAFNVKASDVRVLEFSKNFTRANDQIDAFVPHLLSALRSFYNNRPLTPALAAKLAVFCGRMEVVKLNNRKLDARLQILLYAAYTITGNSAMAATAFDKYRRVEDAVTNEWTKLLIDLIIAILQGNSKLLVTASEKLLSLDASSRAQKMIAAEYEYYISAKSVRQTRLLPCC